MNQEKVFKSSESERIVMEIYNRELAKWTLPYEEKRIQTRYGETYLIISGSKSNPPLILLHGSGGNAIAWSSDISEYSKDFRVYTIDIIGEAGKSAQNRPKLDSPAYSEWLEDIMNSLNISKANIIGVSLGGWIALKFSINHPERVLKLALESSTGIIKARISFIFKILLYAITGKADSRNMMKLLNNNQPIQEDILNFLNIMNTHYQYRTEVPPIFTDDELKKLNMPVFYIGGDHDALLNTKKSAQRLNKLVTKATTCILRDKGHSLTGTREWILPFLKGSDLI